MIRGYFGVKPIVSLCSCQHVVTGLRPLCLRPLCMSRCCTRDCQTVGSIKPCLLKDATLCATHIIVLYLHVASSAACSRAGEHVALSPVSILLFQTVLVVALPKHQEKACKAIGTCRAQNFWVEFETFCIYTAAS